MSVQIIQGDALEKLRELPDASVQMCVTSPPYWGLRDYSTCGCAQRRHASMSALEMCRTIVPGASGQSSATDPRCRQEPEPNCPICNGSGKIAGTEKQLGLEPTPQEYVDKMVSVFAEVRRVLRDDGILWLNLGDTYAAQRGGTCMPAETLAGGVSGKSDYDDPKRGRVRHKQEMGSRNASKIGLKHKDMVGIPWMVAFALRADGWYLRSDVIWAKKNTMPESVTDRPTKSHEHIFLLAKRERYFYNHAAILEPCSENTHSRISQDLENQIGSWRANGGGKTNGPMKPVATQSPESWKGSEFHTGKTSHHQLGRASKNRKLAPSGSGIKSNPSFSDAVSMPVISRNKRDVWFVGTYSYSEAHFATFPPDLIKPCILAGSNPGDTVLDPFGGSGTTGMVAMELGRKAILIELNREYCELIKHRTNITPGLAL